MTGYYAPYGKYRCTYSTFPGIFPGTIATWTYNGWTVNGRTYGGGGQGLPGKYSKTDDGFRWTNGFAVCKWQMIMTEEQLKEEARQRELERQRQEEERRRREAQIRQEKENLRRELAALRAMLEAKLNSAESVINEKWNKVLQFTGDKKELKMHKKTCKALKKLARKVQIAILLPGEISRFLLP